MGKSDVPSATQRHIESVASLEREFLEDRTWSDRVADVVGGFAGTMYFVALHVIVFTSWFLITTGNVPGIRAFDPYPFVLLAMAVSVEAVFLSTFVLMMQNRMAKKADHRSHLNLQVDLLAEKEVTAILQMLRTIGRKLQIENWDETEVDELSQVTSVDTLARQVKHRLGNAT